MKKKPFNGNIDGHPVKTIVKVKATGEKIWFAKPKDRAIPTPDFREYNGQLSIHQDSSDNKYYRAMKPTAVGSGSFAKAVSFVASKGEDFAVLPMNPSADGYEVNTSPSGALVELPKENEWCLMVLGKWGPWRRKHPKKV